MDIRITPTMAKEILEMQTDWEPKFVDENKEYHKGYVSGMRDFLATLRLSREDLKTIINQNR